jgi:hypothetical protein
VAELMNWLEGLKGGAPTVVGAVIGSLLGFLTLVLGALFNAHLNRVRDDNLRKVETRAVAAAIRAELASVEDTLTYNADRLLKGPPRESENFFLPDLSHSVRMFPALTDKLGLLADPAVIREIIQTYVVIDQYCENCLMMGGELRAEMPSHRRILLMSSKRAKTVASMNKEIAGRVQKTMNLLNTYLD